MTATMIGEDPGNANNAKLAGYNDFLRELAAEKKCRVADTSADMIARVKAAREAGTKGNTLTGDGGHMNQQGNRMMATCLLRTMGLDDAQLAKATEIWDKLAEAEAARKRAEARKAEEAARKAEEEARKAAQAREAEEAAAKTMQEMAETK